MDILINYESSWRNSFLDGSNNEALPKKGRNYIASMTEVKKEGNYIRREVTLDTVMGILNRLIGDQRKLYQSRSSETYYFKDVDTDTHPLIHFEDRVDPSKSNEEIVYLRNMKGSEDQNSFTGMIKSDDSIFNSDYSAAFWGVLSLSLDDLLVFLVEDKPVNAEIALDPISVIQRLEFLDKEKPILNEDAVLAAVKALGESFPDASYLNPKGLVKPVMLYCAGLYIQLDRLGQLYDMSTAKTQAGGIGGISKRGFTKKDFMSRYTTGKKKKIWGNPYLKKDRIKGLGEVTSKLMKAGGQLHVQLDIDDERAIDLKNKIDCAGVSSFYLGKKGLAYVSNITI